MVIVTITLVREVLINKTIKMIFQKNNSKLCSVQLKTITNLVKIKINKEELKKLILLLVKMIFTNKNLIKSDKQKIINPFLELKKHQMFMINIQRMLIKYLLHKKAHFLIKIKENYQILQNIGLKVRKKASVIFQILSRIPQR